MSKISIAIPYYPMRNANFYMERCLASIKRQTFKDYEIVVTEAGKMAKNFNEAIKKSKGELIKFLCMDDYLFYTDSLERMVTNFTADWLVTGCVHDDNARVINPHYPTWSDKVIEGDNTIGSPSVLMIENREPLFFNEELTWVVDCDYYKRLYDRYGLPTIVNEPLVGIGLHSGQATNLISEEVKNQEYNYLKEKYET